jgi:hypothetical protein
MTPTLAAGNSSSWTVSSASNSQRFYREICLNDFVVNANLKENFHRPKAE